MTGRMIVIVGFGCLLAAALALVLWSHLRRDSLATLSASVAHLTRTRAARIVAVLIWAWLGWHFLAR